MQIDKFAVKDFPAIDTLGLSDTDHKLRVCIVTEEIIGPVRNGGIASTYYHLSKGLAAHGHEVHVLFLKGPVVQDETPEHWIKHFAEFGVTLHYLEFPGEPCWGVADEWQERFVSAYRWLRDQEPFDVVHTSEWRGGAMYALMAKRLGLAFQETLFLVKTSSPHLWNRHYQMQPITRREMVMAAYSEKKCVELADVVIGGSAHLITFMDQIGYKLPPTNVFVQPNIVDFSKVPVTDQRPPRKPGDVVRTRELIFFGRLEGRKGIELMCNALDILTERGCAPEKVSFMGKWGAPLATQGDILVEDYLAAKIKNWDFPVTLITDKNQPEALSHMCSRDMIAVMPSLIENSTMAVYETLEKNIPFIATAVGGTPELIDAADHAACLVEPKSVALADRLQEALENGQIIAHSSFSNEENLRVWYGFHANVGKEIAEKGRARAIAGFTAGVDSPGSKIDTLSFVVLLRAGDEITHLIDALKADPPDQIILGVNEVSMRPAAQDAEEALTAAGVQARVVEAIGYAAGDALNLLASEQTGEAMVVTHGCSVRPRPGFFAAARAALEHRPDCLFTSFFAGEGNVLGMPVGGDVASHFLTSRAYGPEIFAIRSETYEKLGPFEPYDIRQGILHEYVTRAVETGTDDLLVFPEPLLDWPKVLPESEGYSADTVYSYLKAKPLIDRSSIAQRKVNLAALHLAGVGGAFGDALLRDGTREDDALLWLMPGDWARDDYQPMMMRPLLLAMDEENDTLWLYARGGYDRQLRLRDIAQSVEVVERLGPEGEDTHVTFARFDIPTTWAVGSTQAMSWGFYEDEVKQVSQFLRVNMLSPHTGAIAARQRVLSITAVNSIMCYQRAVAALDTQLRNPGAGEPFFELLESDAFRKEVKQLEISDLRTLIARASDISRPATQDIAALGRKDPDWCGRLLRLAQLTGHEALERRFLQMRSDQLQAELGRRPNTSDGDFRSLLIDPGKTICWRDGDWLTGWARQRDAKERSLHIALMRGDEVLFVVRADHYMPRFGRRTPGLDQHGFRIPVSADLFGDQMQDMRLTIWENGVTVRGGALAVNEAAPLEVVPR